MKPKGHKRGCKCVVCAPRRRRPRKRNHGYEHQALTLHDKVLRQNSTVPVGGTVRGRSAGLRRVGPTRINPGIEDIVAGDELTIFAETSSEPVYRMLTNVHRNLVNKQARGDFDATKARKAFLPVANFAAQEYTREFGTRGPHGSYGIFDAPTRRYVAGHMFQRFMAMSRTGELDYLLAKKYQSTPLRERRFNPRIAGNPAHYPRTPRGPKGNARWYVLDLFDGRGNLISSRYRKCARAKCATEASGLVDRKVGKRMVRKVELSGPYTRKPNAKTTRK